MSDYFEKLKDPRWQKKRLEIFERDGWRCKECYSKEKTLHVHHLFYLKGKEPWEIPNGFLITLCEDCHTAGLCLTELGYTSCKECPDFFENPNGDCEGEGGRTDDIALLLNTLWGKGYNLHEDVYAISEAINKAERPNAFPIECEFSAKEWVPEKGKKDPNGRSRG